MAPVATGERRQAVPGLPVLRQPWHISLLEACSADVWLEQGPHGLQRGA